MNTKISKVLSVLATTAIVASSFAFAMPVAASTPGDGQFTTQDIPSATKNVLFGGSALDMAVGTDGNTVYVVTTLAGSYVMKTTDAGQSFENVQNNLLTVAGAGFVPTAIAVAPDDNNTIAVAGNVAAAPTVVISKDGGTTWATLPAPAGAIVITDIDVAPARSGTLLGREYVISVADPGTGTTVGGDVLIIGQTATWASVGSAVAPVPPAVDPNYITSTMDFMAVKVTPNFLGDRAIVAVGSSAGFPTLIIVNTATSTRVTVATIPAGTTTDFDAAAGATSILSASLTLPTNFDPTTTSGRRSYIGIASVAPTTDNGVYRVDDNTARDLGAVTGAPISSVAYNGTVDSGILFAAMRNNNGNDATDIKYTTGMTATSPTWTTTLKGPSGDAASPAAVIAVASDYATTSRVFAATNGVESAFSVSNDAGVSFVGESLINHTLGNPALSFTGNQVFLTETHAASGYGSIWQSEVPFTSTSWKRIFNRMLLAGAAPPVGVGFALSVNPGFSTTPAMFLFESLTLNAPIYVTQDGGVSWTTRNGPTGAGRQAGALRDAQTVYYVDTAGNVFKSTNAAWTWSTGVSGGVGIIRSITTGRANELIVGGVNGVAISTDDGSSFTAFVAPQGGVVVAPATTTFSVARDSGYNDNNIIYTVDTTGTGAPLQRIDASSTTNSWTTMPTPLGAGFRKIGITTRSGILYVTTNDPATGVMRTLYPNDLVGNQNWNSIVAGLGAAPAVGVTTTAGINLYARVGAVLFAFNDFLATTKPTLTTPADNYDNAINPSNGAGYALDLKMQPMGTGNGQVNAVDVEIVDQANGFTGTATAAGVAVAPTNPIVNTAAIPGFVFQPNKIYQWRVRAAAVASGATLDSPWSDARTINVQSGGIVSQPYVGPNIIGPVGASASNTDPNNTGIAWAPVSGATEYQIIVATDAALSQTVSGTPATTTIPAYQATGLQEGMTYFFAVKATKPTESVQTVGTFTTRSQVAASPTTAPQPTTQPTIVVQAPPAETPAYIWAVIAIGAILVIAVIILIVRTRRVP